jgi:HEPN domain-containing protein
MTRGDAQDWLAHAGADLRYARLGRSQPNELGALIAFHAQQAVEKALKAVLVHHTADFPKTHDLAQLVELIQGIGVNWPARLDPVLDLVPFATHARYPGFDDPITVEEVEQALDLADEAIRWATTICAPPARSETGAS